MHVLGMLQPTHSVVYPRSVTAKCSGVGSLCPVYLNLRCDSGTLSICADSSFCASSLQAQSTNERENYTPHRCGFTNSGSIGWTGERDVTGLLQEILLSCRPFFGEGRRPRSIFRQPQPLAGILHQGHDRLLFLIQHEEI